MSLTSYRAAPPRGGIGKIGIKDTEARLQSNYFRSAPLFGTGMNLRSTRDILGNQAADVIGKTLLPGSSTGLGTEGQLGRHRHGSTSHFLGFFPIFAHFFLPFPTGTECVKGFKSY